MRYLLHFITVTIVALAALAGCRGRDHDPRLAVAADSIAADPKGAAAFLKDIDPASLSADDRHYRDLLTIKALDKAYAIHTSDSLILSVLAWARDYGDDDILTEALYYGGRVYSDLGDYPTAVRYFQDALDRLPPDNCDINLRANILSQTARLLDTMGLFEQAIPYLEAALEIDKQLCDTFNLAFDYQLLSAIFMGKMDFVNAEKFIHRSNVLADNINESDKASIRCIYAAIKQKKGDTDSALILIRGVPELIDEYDKHAALAYASNIYYHAGILDTAFMYAMMIAQSPDLKNKATGYRRLLSPGFRERLPQDSITAYFERYFQALNNQYNHNQAEAVMMQNSYYNYSLYQRENLSLANKNAAVVKWLSATVILILILISSILFYHNRQARKIIALQRTIQKLNQINSNLEKEYNDLLSRPQPLPQSIPDLEALIESDIQTIIERAGSRQNEPKRLSATTESLIAKLSALEHPLNDTNQLWDALLVAICKDAPNLLADLNRYADEPLTEAEQRLAGLIWLGFSTSQTANIFGRSKSAMSHRRDCLKKKLFGDRLTLKEFDSVIRAI